MDLGPNSTPTTQFEDFLLLNFSCHLIGGREIYKHLETPTLIGTKVKREVRVKKKRKCTNDKRSKKDTIWGNIKPYKSFMLWLLSENICRYRVRLNAMQVTRYTMSTDHA